MHKTHHFQTNDKNELLGLISTIFNTSHDGLAICDRKGYVLLYNQAYLQLTGVSADILDNYSFIQQLDMEIVSDSTAVKAIQTKKIYSTAIDYGNGRKTINTATPVLDENQQLLFVVGNVRDITELNQLQRELEETRQINAEFQKALEQIQNGSESNEQLVYRSGIMHRIVALAQRFAKNDSPLLLLGESGVGKDVLANYIHTQSGLGGDFIKINCGAIPDHLLESELFGYEKGAFTGANHAKEGLFELADKGTIFLDEIGDLPYPLQVKLLNVLQDGKIRRLGGKNVRRVQMRIIAATNSDLEAMVEQKRFRQDLYYRLNVLSITIPPLRERREDIPALVFYYLKKMEQKYELEKRIEPEAMETLTQYDWPGNIRELKNVVERTYHMCENGKIKVDELPTSIQRSTKVSLPVTIESFDTPLPLKEAVQRFEKEYIYRMLAQTKTMQECADLLKVNISTLVRKKRDGK
ncbi:sigma-54 dependent transcriptional regulator [Brevibacillus reuszeri]|uniref:Transcriptional regulator n=1 Tax=Brevibacillus reuszeri TaxID=54915 RepID=A0A0K9YNV9_9BACL|nr:sigma 54-interacting transcriptional regulator [Brevibacillus reuszeri]KNB70414.1 transcriptional regulator [Brevibacillus reuszeri]MED1857947.1 sigma 54-interacting transcriptional regulator [Brevibacillus reuszeri]GED71822.1 sigma-54 dependent transcriptional regulator [Brevibacillus reuszeri]